MVNFTPDGLAADFFGVFAPYAPAPQKEALPPVMWGSEEHVRELFGDRVTSLKMTRKEYVEKAASPREYRKFCRRHGPGRHRRAGWDHAATPERYGLGGHPAAG
jgi:2-polyprenyl-6-hydroxyphenyl methylase/3-demethylubiquinone-9 3-methyltransferase